MLLNINYYWAVIQKHTGEQGELCLAVLEIYLLPLKDHVLFLFKTNLSCHIGRLRHFLNILVSNKTITLISLRKLERSN